MKPVSRRTDARLLIALGVAVIGCLFGSQLLSTGSGVIIAVIAGGCAWLLTGLLSRRNDHLSAPEQDRPDHPQAQRNAEHQGDVPD